MSSYKEMIEYIVDTMSPDLRFNEEDRQSAIDFLTVEVASLIQDSHNDEGVLIHEANRIMTLEDIYDDDPC